MTAILTVTSKNQVTFPADLMTRFRVAKGDKLLLKVKGKTLEIEKIETSLRSLQGSLASTRIGKKSSLEEVIKMAEKSEAKRLMDES